VLVATESGMRRGEVAHLEREDILDGQIVVRAQKPKYGFKTAKSNRSDARRTSPRPLRSGPNRKLLRLKRMTPLRLTSRRSSAVIRRLPRITGADIAIAIALVVEIAN
jgi:integrase